MGERRTVLRNVVALTPLVFAGAVTSGCATFPSHQLSSAQVDAAPSVLVSVTPAPPPRGALDFCSRTDACGGRPPPGESVDLETTDVTAPDRGQDSAAERFRFMLLARSRGERSTVRAQQPFTETRWRELATTNEFVNEAIEPVHDAAQFGVTERWTTPLTEAEDAYARPRGDCEDYALEKRSRLLSLGWAPETVTLAIARLPTGALHLVLIAQTDRGDFVLDNLHRRPLPIAALQYDWLIRQAGPNLGDWDVARLVTL
jgi:predicted transglutaminase-like cysteine proteinase